MQCLDQNQQALAVGDKVLIVGTVSGVAQVGGLCKVTVDVQTEGDSSGVVFNSDELIKPVPGNTITGVVSGPT